MTCRRSPCRPCCPATATRVLQLVVFIPLFVSGYGQLRDCGQLGVYFFYLVVLIAVVFVQL